MRALSLTLPLLLLFWGCEGCDKKPAEQELATLIQVQGQVTVLRAAESRLGRVDERIYAGELVSTGAGSTARVRYINGVEVEVAESSRFRVSGVPGALSLELEEGRIISTSPQAAGGGLTITGRFGKAQLMTAAEMVFDLRDENPRLTLQYGEISVVGPDGKSVPVLVGEELTLSLNKPQQAPPPVLLAEEIVFTLKPQGGKARVRGAQESAFTEVGPDQARELGAGAAFEVPARSSARLSSSELQVSLSGDTAGTLTSASRQGEQKSYALQLGRGKARLQFAPGQHSLQLTDAKGAFELKVSEQSTVSVSDPQDGATVFVHTGQIELVVDGTTTLLEAGEGLSRTSSAPQVAQGPAPALVLPSSAKTRVFTDALREAGIQVPSSSGGPLRVEVSEEPGFKELVLAGRAGADLVRVEPPNRGELHWRFLAEDGSVREQGSARFQPDRGRSAMVGESPRAEVLETGLKASVTFQSAAPSLRFSFSPRQGARSYQLRIYRDGDVKTPLLQRATDKSQYTLEPGALREGNYLWYVAALGSGGVELAGGRMNKLELVYDNARRGLALSRPRPGERPGRDGVPVEGVVPLGSRLFVNGQPVALDAKGRFSQRLSPTGVLVFRLVSEQGEAYWVRTLRSGG